MVKEKITIIGYCSCPNCKTLLTILRRYKKYGTVLEVV